MTTSDAPTPTDPREEQPFIPPEILAMSPEKRAQFIEQFNAPLTPKMHPVDDLQSTNSKLAAEIAELKKGAPINTHVRLFDLVRYQRSELLHAGLITEEEYGWLCYGSDMANSPKGGSPSRQRLEDYDTLRAELEAARKEIAAPRFHVPDTFLDNFGPYIAELPAHQILPDGGFFSKEALVDLLNQIKNGMRKALDTALAAKDAAEKALGLEKRRVVGMQRTGEEMQAELDAAVDGLRDIDRAIAGFFWTSDDGKTLRDAEPEESGAPQWFIETWKGLRILIAALTPAPTQEPPAGGVKISTAE